MNQTTSISYTKNFHFKTVVILLLSFVLLLPLAICKETSKKESEKKSPEQEQPTPSRAEERIQVHSFGVGIGETFLKGEFSEYGDNSITADLFYNYKASYSFDFLVNGHYSEHKSKQQEVIAQGIAFAIKGRFYQFDNFSPFCLGGIGFYRPVAKRYVQDVGGYVSSEKKLTFGVHAGIGADLTLNEILTVGILAHYHNPFDIKQDLGPEVEGSYLKLLMTLMISI